MSPGVKVKRFSENSVPVPYPSDNYSRHPSIPTAISFPVDPETLVEKLLEESVVDIFPGGADRTDTLPPGYSTVSSSSLGSRTTRPGWRGGRRDGTEEETDPWVVAGRRKEQ